MTTSIFLKRGNPELQNRADILRFEDRIVLIVRDVAIS